MFRSSLFENFSKYGFKLSKNNIIKILKKTIPLIIIILLDLLFIPLTLAEGNDNTPNTDTSSSKNLSSDGSGNNLNLTASVSLTQSATKIIGDAMVNAASNIDLETSIGGTAAAVAGVVAKTGLPLAHKVVYTGLGAAIGGAVHVGASALYRNAALSLNTKSTSAESPSSPTDFLPTMNEESIGSPLETLLNSIFTLNIITLLLIIFLLINIIIIIYISKNDKLELK